jgi:hypothetical protein
MTVRYDSGSQCSLLYLFQILAVIEHFTQFVCTNTLYGRPGHVTFP